MTLFSNGATKSTRTQGHKQISPVANHMPEREAESMEKYQSHDGSRSQGTRSQNGPSAGLWAADWDDMMALQI